MLNIGGLKLKSNIIAAPMAGFTDAAWRVLAVRWGAGLVFSEMISVGSIVHKNRAWRGIAGNDDRARPYSLQLFGANPDWFARALEAVDCIRFDAVDINFGCPMKKIVSTGAGCAVMRRPADAEKILKTARAVYHGPLTVKIRSGWDEKSINAPDIARIAEACGASAVIVHPRTRTQAFYGVSDWKVIRAVKNSVSIPVIGSGDVVDRQSAERMFAETGCDGIMIGRRALERPWIFREIAEGYVPEVEEIFKIMREHAELVLEFKDGASAHNAVKKFVPKYFKGMRGVKELSRKVNTSADLKSALERLERFEHLHHGRH